MQHVGEFGRGREVFFAPVFRDRPIVTAVNTLLQFCRELLHSIESREGKFISGWKAGVGELWVGGEDVLGFAGAPLLQLNVKRKAKIVGGGIFRQLACHGDLIIAAERAGKTDAPKLLGHEGFFCCRPGERE